MQYSLLSHFQGCLLGMGLGEQVGRAIQPVQASVDSAAAPLNQDGSSMRWSSTAIDLLQELTKSHQWQAIEPSTAILQKVPTAQRQSAGIAIATLPLALFFHDDLNRQRRTLWQLFESLSVDAVHRAWVIVFAYTIAQAVKGQLDPYRLLPQLLAYLRVTHTAEHTMDNVLKTLEQAETYFVEQASLHQILTDWSNQVDPIAIALVIFLQTPEDLRLTLARMTHLCRTATHLLVDAPSVHALVGALVGAQTSLAGIPPFFQCGPGLLPGDRSVSQIKALAEALFASWSGLYTPTLPTPSLPVAAPWVIRP